MARYKYSENTKEVTDIYFDTETHGEYMGMEQGGEMKHIKGPTLKSAIEDVAKDVAEDGAYDNTDSGLTATVIKDAIDEVAGEIDTLNADDTTEGSVLKDIKDNAQDATYDNSTSGLTAETLGGAIDEVEGRVDTAEGEIDELQTAETAIKGTGWTNENLVDHESRLDILEADDTTEGSIAYNIKQSSDALKGVGYTDGTLKTHEDRLGVLENDVDTEGSVLKSIKDNAEDATYDNTDSGLIASTLKTAIDENAGDIDDLQTAETAMKGTGWTNENLVDHEDRLDTLEGADTVVGSVAKTVKDAVEPIETRLDTTELTLARQGQDLASVKQTLQQGNGVTLDFSNIGSVSLDARATGRANPTVKGLTATNLVENGDFSQGTTRWESFQTYSILSIVSGNLRATYNKTKVYFGTMFSTIIPETCKEYLVLRIRGNKSASAIIKVNKTGIGLDENWTNAVVVTTEWQTVLLIKTTTNSISGLDVDGTGFTSVGDWIEIDGNYGVTTINLTQTFGAGNEPNLETCQKLFSNYFDGTKSISMPARVRSVSEDESETSTLYIADNEELRSVPAISDEVKVVNGQLVKVQRVSDAILDGSLAWGSFLSGRGPDANVSRMSLSNTAITPLISPLDIAYGYLVGKNDVHDFTVGAFTSESAVPFSIVCSDAYKSIFITIPDAYLTDNYTLSQAGFIAYLNEHPIYLMYQLATPITTPLLTSGILQAKPNGSVYFEPYYEGSHQTDAYSQITLPYEGTIEAVYGYDEDLVEYLLDSSEYSLAGNTLTITDALENEVFFVQMSRSELLAPEMSVNTLNNDQVIADTSNGKFYKLVPTITDGTLVSQTPVEVV
jgi:hypothetical protein